jgi:hypothetical protein
MSPDLYNRFDRPLRLDLGDSPLLLKVLVTLHLAGVSAWLVLPLSPLVRVTAVAILLGQFWRLKRLHVRPLARHAVQALYWEKDTGWKVRTAGGWYSASLCQPCYVTAQLAAVRFRIGRYRRVTAIVVADRVEADDFRRLLVRLLQRARSRQLK